MSRETLEHLNTNTLIGYTDKRGNAWHYRAEKQGAESNHYAGAIPVDDVVRRLFAWRGVEGEISATALTETGVLSTVDPERKAIMRSDTGAILGVFKSGYRIHQYKDWLIENVEMLLDADLAIGSAGLLKGGAVAWVQIEMEDTLEAPGGVKYRPFLTAATSMDGSIATTYQTGAQVVVCDNTLSTALASKDSSRFKVKHSRFSLNKVQDVRDALGIVHTVASDFEAQVQALIDEQVNADRWRAFVAAHTEIDKAREAKSKRGITLAENKSAELNRLWNHDERVSPWAGTAYGVLAAVNTYTHHVATVRNATRVERNMERAVTGGIDRLDADTLRVLATV
ncbi:DUF932 domain-containing protein [Cellulomonas sp. SG140]|uniref:DUF932 domain-containing protein n=1 Tax=Cellulomonas sp. SG140 TaxID=2976536 RepID=UPI0021E875E0|nr:DUF932 domain-containing protein [Cellulomonas sp. SG140]